IERAIAKGAGEGTDGSTFETVVYEGYGPEGVAVIVEALTDNRNRTASDVRHLFSKHGGNLGATGAVAWQFEGVGGGLGAGGDVDAGGVLPGAAQARARRGARARSRRRRGGAPAGGRRGRGRRRRARRRGVPGVVGARAAGGGARG